MTNYQRGYRFEVRVRKFLEGLGFQVMRSAGSKGPADLAAFGRGQVLLFSCKVDQSDFTIEGNNKLYRMARAGGGWPFLAWREKKRLIFSEVMVMRSVDSGTTALDAIWINERVTEREMRRRFGFQVWRPDEEPLPPWYKGEEGDG